MRRKRPGATHPGEHLAVRWMMVHAARAPGSRRRGAPGGRVKSASASFIALLAGGSGSDRCPWPCARGGHGAARHPERAVLGSISALAGGSDRPLVLLFDEADGLVGPAMVSSLAQRRAGYLDRSHESFPSRNPRNVAPRDTRRAAGVRGEACDLTSWPRITWYVRSMTARKIAISVPASQYAALERVRKRLRLNRSEAVSRSARDLARRARGR